MTTKSIGVKCAALYALVVVGAGVSSVPEAEAREEYVNEIPNGAFFTCNTCHIGVQREENFNVFGAQVFDTLQMQSVQWSEIYDLDADGDGFSNGAELGDPRGAFMEGSSAARPYLSNPADANSVPLCGNGMIDLGGFVAEQCDGQAEMTCEVIGGVASERPACTEFCMLDYDACVTFPDPDMGTPPEDMGTEPVDMGSVPRDMGAAPVDMGASAMDMGGEGPVGMDPVAGTPDDADEVPDFQLEGEPFLCANAARGNGSLPMPRVFWVLLAWCGVRRFRR